MNVIVEDKNFINIKMYKLKQKERLFLFHYFTLLLYCLNYSLHKSQCFCVI